MTRIKLFFVFFALILFDQLSKYIIRTSGGFYICNINAAFGLSLGPVFSLVVFISLSLFLFNLKFKIFNFKSISNFKFQISNFKKSQIFSIILLFSGGASNIIDRLNYGCVIDFIDLKFWPVFNFADVYITIGAIMLIIQSSKLKVKN